MTTQINRPAINKFLKSIGLQRTSMQKYRERGGLNRNMGFGRYGKPMAWDNAGYGFAWADGALSINFDMTPYRDLEPLERDNQLMALTYEVAEAIERELGIETMACGGGDIALGPGSKTIGRNWWDKPGRDRSKYDTLADHLAKTAAK